MEILITGVAGFIGVNLSKRLLKDGHRVIGIDNFYTSEKRKLDELATFENFLFIQKDITESWDDIYSKIKSVEAACNLACPASPPMYLRDSIYTTKVSVLGILHALEFVTKKNIPLLHTSTSEVYGDPLEHPQKETYYGNVNPIGIRSCYDEGKRVAESLCFDFYRQHGTKIKVVRIFNTYGPFMERNDGRVISNFINAALQNTPLTVFGDGMQTRCFCYIDDLVEGLQRFLFLKDSAVQGPINLGSTEELSIVDLTKQLKNLFPNIRIEYKSRMENDPQIRRPDISRAQSLLGWSPQSTLEEGLQRTVAWFSSYYGMEADAGQ